MWGENLLQNLVNIDDRDYVNKFDLIEYHVRVKRVRTN